MVNVPDSKLIRLYVDDEPLLLSIADLEHYDRTLDFRTGRLTRSLVWRTPAGKRVQVDSTRMVSMTNRHLAVMTFEVTLLDGDAPVALSLAAAEPAGRRGRVPRPRRRHGPGHSTPARAPPSTGACCGRSPSASRPTATG